MDELIPRSIAPILLEALGESRAVCVIGPRQAGKTTLVRDLIRERFPAAYITLDDRASLAAAFEDPVGFVARLDRPTIIDEVQRAPDLLLGVKERLDRDRRPGQFLLTGSANIITLPTIRDSLPGRVDYVRLWPFSQSEIEGHRANLVDALFEGVPPRIDSAPVGRESYAARIAAGGFPAAYRRTTAGRKRFFDGYVESLLGRDVPDIARLRNTGVVGRLLRLVAARSATLLSRDSLARDVGLDRKTVDAHLRILEELLLIRRHAAWHTNLSQREIKTPKVFVADTGMLAALVGANERRIASDPSITGMAFETFAITELVKLSTWSQSTPDLFHYRDRDGREVDAVLERSDGSVVGVEIKAAASVDRRDFRSLSLIRDRVGSRLRCGVVFYTGRLTLPFGDRIWAIPLSALWT